MFLLVFIEQEQYYFLTKKYLISKTVTDITMDIKNFCFQLNLFVDENGLIRSKGRIENAALDYDTQNPILLSPKSHLSTLIIEHLHKGNHHCGVNNVLVLLRERFWLPKVRQTIKKILSKCVLCQKVTKDRMKLLPPPPLPPE